MLDRLARRFGQVHPNHKRVARGALWVGLFVLAAKVVGALREVAIAWRYGVTDVVDAYQIGVTVSTWLAMTLTGVATAVLVPRLVALANDRPAYRAFVSELNAVILLLAGGLALITFIAAPWAVGLLSAGLPAETRAMAVTMSRLLAPAAGLMMVAGYLAVRLQARERYAYSFIEAMPALTVAILVVVLPAGQVLTPLVLGTLAGLVIQVAWLGRMTRQSDGELGSLHFSRRAPEWRSLQAAFLTMALGQFLVTVSVPIDQAFSATLGEGAVATLGYVNRIIGLFTGLGSVVVARAVLPVVSGAVANGEARLGAIQSLKWGALMFVLALAGTAIVWALSPLAVRLLFERGAFGPQETAAVAEILRFGLFQLPGVFCGLVLVQLIAAEGRFRFILGVTAFGLLAKLVGLVLLTPGLGLRGVMLSTAAMYMATTLIMAGSVWRSATRPQRSPGAG